MASIATTNGGENSVLLDTGQRPCWKGEESASSTSREEGGASSNERETWASKREYILSVVGYCVGLGNIWRFPYICMKNGGGAFLIPFVLALLICGLPGFFVESVLGQFVAKSPYHVWAFCPIFKGVGLAMAVVSTISAIYFPMLMAWSLIYVVNSLQSPLPWTLCGQSWNTPGCFTIDDTTTTSTPNITGHNHSATKVLGNLMTSGHHQASGDVINASTISSITQHAMPGGAAVSSSEEFWLHNILEMSSGIYDIGGFPWPSVLGLVVTNTCVFLGILKGVRTSGKVVYVTAILPYVLLTVILVLGFTLPGAADGVLFYIKPDFSKLLSYEPWMEAAIQVFYSLGTGVGCIITMSSYNKFNNNCMRDSVLLTFCCEGTSLYGGFVVFMILGHMAFKSGVHISKFAESGAGLAFVVYPEAISYLPLPQFWGVIFFVMFFTLGLDSLFVLAETPLTVLTDFYPRFVHRWRAMVTLVFMVALTLLSLLFSTRAGIYWFTLVDWYFAAFLLFLHVILECVAVSWIYGFDRFSRDVVLMTGRKPYLVLEWAMKYVTPLFVTIVSVVTLCFYQPPVYRGYEFPGSAVSLGWLCAVLPCLPIVGCAIHQVYNQRRHGDPLRKTAWLACQSSSDWMPASPEVRDTYHPSPGVDDVGGQPADAAV